jgi:hypothetical protein
VSETVVGDQELTWIGSYDEMPELTDRLSYETALAEAQAVVRGKMEKSAAAKVAFDLAADKLRSMGYETEIKFEERKDKPGEQYCCDMALRRDGQLVGKVIAWPTEPGSVRIYQGLKIRYLTGKGELARAFDEEWAKEHPEN